MLETDDHYRRLQALAEGSGFSVRKRVVPALIEKGRIFYIVDTRNELDSFGDFATLDEAEAFLNFLIRIRRERECPPPMPAPTGASLGREKSLAAA
ncbi:hypothetical protein [Rhodoligotrophos defluvii]|uniref:hypothetical protein n=1 Tax=Rhodoligotrophos defluvii TaxID=2561934 RepID=UPI0010C9F939|nr:hypothetical protein [Rhodoligotrophos defluvii]